MALEWFGTKKLRLCVCAFRYISVVKCGKIKWCCHNQMFKLTIKMICHLNSLCAVPNFLKWKLWHVTCNNHFRKPSWEIHFFSFIVVAISAFVNIFSLSLSRSRYFFSPSICLPSYCRCCNSHNLQLHICSTIAYAHDTYKYMAVLKTIKSAVLQCYLI